MGVRDLGWACVLQGKVACDSTHSVQEQLPAPCYMCVCYLFVFVSASQASVATRLPRPAQTLTSLRMRSAALVLLLMDVAAGGVGHRLLLMVTARTRVTVR